MTIPCRPKWLCFLASTETSLCIHSVASFYFVLATAQVLRSQSMNEFMNWMLVLPQFSSQNFQHCIQTEMFLFIESWKWIQKLINVSSVKCMITFSERGHMNLFHQLRDAYLLRFSSFPLNFTGVSFGTILEWRQMWQPPTVQDLWVTAIVRNK